ncbi:MAG: hypothetical protein JWM33_2595 [Caulobacteraceae bacterium]|nr:hypothetical protein [Caulobacteraceae bacterium]
MHSLEDLVTPAGREAFGKAFDAKTRWAFVAPRPQAAALLPWKTIEQLIGDRLVPPGSLRVALNGHDLAASLFTDEQGRLKASTLLDLASQGATLVINDIGSFVPAIGDVAAAIERELRCTTGVNAYVSFGALSAFVPHSDGHDVLILHLHGAKRWRSFGSPLAVPLTGTRPSVTDAEWEGLMTPGDLLYLPRGEVHAAVPEIRPSVHLTISLADATGVDFVKWLATRAEAREDLRRDLGAGLEAQARASRDPDLFQAIQALLAQATVADFLTDRDRERPLRSLACFNPEGRLGPDTQLRSALRRRLDMATGVEGEAVLTFGKRQIRLSQLARRALDDITRHNRTTVGDLAARLGAEALDTGLQAAFAELARQGLIGMVEG